MYATVRRYEGTDRSEAGELTSRIEESLIPRLSGLPGFGGNYLIDAGEGVITSIGLFDTAGQAHESTRVPARSNRSSTIPGWWLLRSGSRTRR